MSRNYIFSRTLTTEREIPSNYVLSSMYDPTHLLIVITVNTFTVFVILKALKDPSMSFARVDASLTLSMTKKGVSSA